MSVIAECVSKVTVGEPQTHGNLNLLPLLGDGVAAPDYLVLDEALKAGCACLTEVSDAGVVPELRFVNECDAPVLLIEGEELVGAKQNRIVNLSVLLPPHETIVVPVSCVEAGRWHAESHEFASASRGHYAAGRAQKARHVSMSMRTIGSRSSDQSEVWADISAKSVRLRSASPTGAAAALYQTHRATLDEYLAAFSAVPSQLGALFVLNGRVLGLDLFDSHRTLTALLPKLVESSALDAIDAGETEAEQGAGQEPEKFLNAVAGSKVERFDALGLGEDLRFRDPNIAGGALLVDDRLVHLCAFGLIAREGTDSDEWRDQVLTQETDRTMPDINARTDIGLHGFVYILRVTDIDLPVCKIGSTTKDPQVRCAEINRSSTGDFIWTVAHSVPVDDCRRLESLVHKSLSPMKQAGREFFNLGAESAYRALVSILDSQTGINGVNSVEPNSEQSGSSPNAQMPSKSVSYSPLHSGCADLFDTFASVLGVQVKPWGQAARPAFGVSDGNDGVQWNLAVEKATRRVRLGVNLEGKQYINWPIATFILSELSNPEIMSVINQLQRPQDVNLRFSRDAWQVTARPLIEEKYIGGAEPSFRELDAKRWERILDEALGCLNENVNFRGRARQTVTLKSELTTKPRERVMEVSPHLNVWSAVSLDGDLRQNIEREMTALRPVYDWVRRVSQS